MKVSARDAYDRLFKYFGLRARDGYLEGATGTNTPKPQPTFDSVLGDVYHFLYGDETVNPDINEICQKISEMPGGMDKKKEVICVTPYRNDIKIVSNDQKQEKNDNKVPFNDKTITNLSDQGLTADKSANVEKKKFPKKKTSEEDPKFYTIQDLDPLKFDDDDNRIDVVQVFPCRGVAELADTDVLTLYLSTINSINMSQAVPFVDVLVTVQGNEGDPIATRAFSFGNFLEDDVDNLSNNAMLNAKFQDQSTSGAGNITYKDRQGNDVKRNLQTVASMEIFTSPQTLVNATEDRIRYDENSEAGRHVDIFRPFLAIESLGLSVVPAGAGLIAFKTANMKLRLFDRGNLSKISPLVAPSRFGVVKFDIEYGWSHPAGKLVARQSDAQDDRIGELIDSMRVKESYQVVNSNFSFEQDGSVSIDLKLSMLGAKSLSSKSVSFSGSETDVADIEFLLQEIRKLLSNVKGKIDVPAVIAGGTDSFISMTPEDKKKLRAFANSLVSGKKNGSPLTKAIGQKVSALIGKNDKDTGSKYKKFQDNRKKQVKNFIDNLRVKDDPFIRTKGLRSLGVTSAELTGNNNTNYASLGSIIVSTIGPVFQEVGDVVFIFSCFNKNAGAMYDHNIAQFPIKISSGNDKDVVLQNVLERTMKKTSRITPESFLQLLNENFILRESTEAYGLSDLYKQVPVFDEEGQVSDQYANKVKVDSEKPESQLEFEDKKVNNLEKLYGEGNRNHPAFTLPRISMKIDVKPSVNGENIVRVLIFDQAASNVGDIQEIFNDVTGNGFFEKEEYVSPPSDVRSARHNEVAEKVFQELTKKGNEIIESYSPSQQSDQNSKEKDPPTLLEKLEQIAGESVQFESGPARKFLEKKLSKIFFLKKFETADRKLRNVFYRFFPTLIYGSMGSGIISAQLASNQNDALTTIALQKQENEVDFPVGLPMLVHPTQLSMEVFGTPMFKYSQKFFIDFGTGTSADNFYVVGGVDMNFGPGEFKTSLKMIQLDAFGRFMKTRDSIYKTLISSYVSEKSPKPEKPKKKK